MRTVHAASHGRPASYIATCSSPSARDDSLRLRAREEHISRNIHHHITKHMLSCLARARGQLLGDVMGHAGTTSIVTLRVFPLPFDPSHAHIVGLQATTLGDRVFCCCHRTARMEQFIPATIRHGWLGSRVVSVLDSDAGAYRFKSQSRRCRLTVLGKLFTPIASLFTKQPNW